MESSGIKVDFDICGVGLYEEALKALQRNQNGETSDKAESVIIIETIHSV